MSNTVFGEWPKGRDMTALQHAKARDLMLEGGD